MIDLVRERVGAWNGGHPYRNRSPQQRHLCDLGSKCVVYVASNDVRPIRDVRKKAVTVLDPSQHERQDGAGRGEGESAFGLESHRIRSAMEGEWPVAMEPLLIRLAGKTGRHP